MSDVEDIVIVSRHPAAIQFVKEHLSARGIDADRVPVLASATDADVRGRDVYGNLPMHLAAVAWTVWVIEFDVPPRGQEYTIDDMWKAGARLRSYTVRRDTEGGEE